tara:strand:- start:180 stop:305 length:126 start_codon:yes stop_codon:yes gene_type:complete
MVGAIIREIGEAIENTIGISTEFSLIIGFVIVAVIFYILIK